MRVRALLLGTVALGAGLLAPSATSAAPAREPLVVVDVTAEAGVGGVVNDEDAHGGCSGDLNGDGKADLVLSRHINDPAQVYLDNGDGTYRVSQTLNGVKDPHGCALWDWERDGDLDVAIAVGAERGTATDKSNVLLLGDGTGRLTPGPPLDGGLDGTGRGRTVAAANLDGLAPRDFIIGNAPEVDGQPSNGRAYLRDWRNGVRDVSGPISQTSLGACALGVDWTGDRRDDPILCTGGGLSLWVNHDNGTRWQDVGNAWGLGYATYAAAGDVNGDDRPDLVTVSNTAIKVFLWRTDRLALAYSRPLREGIGVAIADVDRDGTQDVYAVTGSADRSGTTNLPDVLLLGDGTGKGFTDASQALPQETVGAGSGVLVLEHAGRTRLLVTNGGGDGAATNRGPRRLLEFR